MKQPIELRRLRDFGQTINDSFEFLKENFKPLFKALIIICGFFILVSIVTTAASYMNLSTLGSIERGTYDGSTKPWAIIISSLVSAFILVLTQAFIILVTLCYISVYLQKHNATPTLEEVWGYFRYYFFRVLLSGILIFFILVAGLMFCFIPGIWLYPILYLIIPIIVIENSSFGYAFNKSFRLIKNNWWLVFGVLFVMSLIVAAAGSIISIPISIILKSGSFLSLKSFTTPVIIAFSVFRSLLLLAYVLPSIAICLCYFSLVEEKDGTGLLDRIEKLGTTNNSHPPLPTEEY